MSQQLSLLRGGNRAADGLRVGWRAARAGVRIWIEERGEWRPGIIVHRGRKHVTVMIGRPASRAVYQRRAYRELRRRVIKPRLFLVGGADNGQANLRGRR